MLTVRTIYNSLISLFYVGFAPTLLVLALFNFRGRRHEYLGRLGFASYGVNSNEELNKSFYWVHLASVGEYRMVEPFLKDMKERNDVGIVLTVMTATGYKLALDAKIVDYVYYIPLELPRRYEEIICKFNIERFFAVDTEIWSMLLHSLKEAGVYCCLINGRISDKTYKSYLRFSKFVASALSNYDKIYTKSTEDLVKFQTIMDSALNWQGELKVGGSMKMYTEVHIQDKDDDAGYKPNNIDVYNTMKTLSQSGKILSLVSTHERNYKVEKKSILGFVSKGIDMSSFNSEEEAILFSYSKLDGARKFKHIVIAPRHISRADSILAIAKKCGFSAVIFSEYKKSKADNITDYDVIIVDEFGCLTDIMHCSNRIFYGGSLINIGGHNIMEAVLIRRYVYSGIYCSNFTDVFTLALDYKVVHLIKEDIFQLFVVDDEHSADAIIEYDKFNDFLSSYNAVSDDVRNNYLSLLW